MRVLLDECVPRTIRKYLLGLECVTVPEAGFAGKKNGELLRLAEEKGFDIFLSLDRGIEYEQNLQNHAIAVMIVRAKTSRVEDVARHAPEILKALKSIQSRQFVKIGR